MRLILNADDLGMSREVNDAVFTLMGKGKITSATILANGQAVEDAVRKLSEFSQCSFGVHLYLTQLRPLTAQRDLEPLLNGDGTFRPRISCKCLKARVREAVFVEWKAQVDRLRSLGVTLSHIDSHHNAHTVAQLFFALKKIQAYSGINKVRIRSTGLLACGSQSLVQRFNFGKRSLRSDFWNFAVRHFSATTTTSGYASFGDFLARAKVALIHGTSLELGAHPGHPQYEYETCALELPWRDQVCFPTELINYTDL